MTDNDLRDRLMRSAPDFADTPSTVIWAILPTVRDLIDRERDEATAPLEQAGTVLLAALTAARQQLAAVRTLHRSYVRHGETFCAPCMDGDGYSLPYPCPTIRALDSATPQDTPEAKPDQWIRDELDRAEARQATVPWHRPATPQETPPPRTTHGLTSPDPATLGPVADLKLTPDTPTSHDHIDDEACGCGGPATPQDTPDDSEWQALVDAWTPAARAAAADNIRSALRLKDSPLVRARLDYLVTPQDPRP